MAASTPLPAAIANVAGADHDMAGSPCRNLPAGYSSFVPPARIRLSFTSAFTLLSISMPIFMHGRSGLDVHRIQLFNINGKFLKNIKPKEKLVV